MSIADDIRRLLDEGALTGAEIAQSLNSLCKYSNGKWKSEKQARFLLNQLDTYRNPDAAHWASRYKPEGHYVAVLITHKLEAYGHREQSKIRYVAYFFLVDEIGVKARAKVKYDHKKGGIVASSADETFLRPDTDVDKALDMGQELRDRIARKARQMSLNKEILKRIEGIPGWADKEILQSLYRQLEQGRQLSANQLAVIDSMSPPKMVPEKKTEVKRMWDELITHMRHEWAPVLDAWQLSFGNVIDSNAHLTRITQGQDIGWAVWNVWGDVLYDILEHLHIRPSVAKLLKDDILTTNWFGYLPGHIDKALEHKGKRPLTKATLRYLQLLTLFHERFLKIDQTRLRRILAPRWGDDPPPGENRGPF